ncbi:MAG TPA: wax ester/triacylglycerol synthase family O-acyltransferase [Chloroflexi bacterium]|nr:wax ester/triacylglycerol synthase family O-acyltransferase [Chloroflexota bacterium]
MSKETKRTPMSSVDKAWFEMDSATNLMIINGLMWFDGKVDFDLFTHILENRFIERYERFRQRVVTGADGRLYWEQDPHFDLRAHVRRVSLPEPRTQEGLQTLVSSIINEPLDRRKPLWRFFLVEDVEGGAALFGRIHHCIGDGIALIRVLLDMTSEEQEASLQLTPTPAQMTPRKQRRGLLGAALHRARGLAHTSVDLGKTLVSQTLLTLEDPSHPVAVAKSLGLVSAASAAILAKLLILPPDRPTVFKGELSAIKRVVWSQPLELEKIKAIGRAFDATINDVLVAAVAGALRDYMISVHDDPDAGNINAMVPVNLRPLDRAGELGNQFALVYLPLTISLADPVARLKATKHAMDVLKQSPEPFLVYQILGIIGNLPLDVARQATTWFSTKASAVLTNVPGPRQQIYFAGLPLRRLMFWVPQSGQISMGISIISYNGTVMLGLMVDDNLVKQPQIIMDRFAHQFDLLAARVHQHNRQDAAGRQAIPITTADADAAEETGDAAPAVL